MLYRAYVHFNKAFDCSVVHSKLLNKLVACGVSGCLLHWIAQFLSNRIRTTLDYHCPLSRRTDEWHIVQGSGIDPLLFLVFITDLIGHLMKYGVRLKLIADDVKVYSEIIPYGAKKLHQIIFLITLSNLAQF